MTADDGKDYFAKFPETCAPADQMSVAIEMIVAQIGQMIGAPVVDAVLMLVPDAFKGQPLKPGIDVESSVVHASLALEQCDELGRPNLIARSQDDNRDRHAGIYALYDLFVGCDQQWLYDLQDDRSIYSHDHGLYLPPEGQGRWNEPDLVRNVSRPHVLPDDPRGLDPAAVARLAEAVRSLKREDLAMVLNRVPASWSSVTDADLEALGWFLESRAPGVADRLEALTR